MDNRRDNQPYSYFDAGFNNFLDRGIGSSAAVSLNQMSSDLRKVNTQEVNFDQQSTSGALGDTIRVGEIYIDGANRRISVFEEGGVNEVGRIGNLDG